MCSEVSNKATASESSILEWKANATNGQIITAGNGRGDHLNQFNGPTSTFVAQDYSLYISDQKNHRMMKWCIGVKEGTIVVGGNGQGQQSNQFHCPTSASFDRHRNLYVLDCTNNRIQKFQID
jgi:hypothetical protein